MGNYICKELCTYIRFDYVSLPLISANMIGADYAQPGLVAEGYANWGIYGAIINMIFVFSLQSYCLIIFTKTIYLKFVTLYWNFSQVLLDGGPLILLFSCLYFVS